MPNQDAWLDDLIGGAATPPEPSPDPQEEIKKLEKTLRKRLRETNKEKARAKRKVAQVEKVLAPTPYNPADFGTSDTTSASNTQPAPQSAPQSAETRNADPLEALAAGQKVIAGAQDGFAQATSATLAVEMRSLDPRERKFVSFMFNGVPADEAVERAGYPPRPNFAMQLVAKPHIRAAMDWMQKEYLRSVGATLTNAVTEMVRIAFLDPRKVVDSETGKPIPLHKLDAATAAAIQAVEVTETDFNGVSTITKTKYTFNSKLKALQQLGDHLGLFNQTQHVEVTGANGGPIQMEMSQNEIARRMLFVLGQQKREIVDVTPVSE